MHRLGALLQSSIHLLYVNIWHQDDEFIELSDQNELRTGLASRKRMYSGKLNTLEESNASKLKQSCLAIDGGNSSDARSGLGSLFSISAFRLPIPPRTPSPPQSPRLSYSTFEGSMEEWNVQIIRAAVNSKGLPSLTEWEDTTLSSSTYLRENKWAAAYPLKRPEDSVLKDGQGLLGVGGSKVAIFVRLRLSSFHPKSPKISQRFIHFGSGNAQWCQICGLAAMKRVDSQRKVCYDT